MGLENSWLLRQARRLSEERVRLLRASLLLALLFFVAVSEPTSAQAPGKRNVLILSDVGMSHSLTAAVTQQIVAGVRETPDRHVEFYSESLDLQAFPGKPSRGDAQEWLAKKYGDDTLDVIVAVGPGAIEFLSSDAQALFPEVPIVICGSASDHEGNRRVAQSKRKDRGIPQASHHGRFQPQK